MKNIEDKITEYLAAGGLFNPEMMEHDKVRDLLIEAREELKSRRDKLHAGYDIIHPYDRPDGSNVPDQPRP